MTLIYGLAIALGAAGVVAAVALAVNPQRRALPETGRNGLLGLLGFGLGGMSSSFAGWPSVLAFVGALAGAAVLIRLSMRYSVLRDE